MKNFKRCIAMIAIYLMVITFLPLGVLNQVVSAETNDNYNYNYSGNYDFNWDDEGLDSLNFVNVDATISGSSISATISDIIAKDKNNIISFQNLTYDEFLGANSVSVKFESTSAIEAFKSGAGSVFLYSMFAMVDIPFSVIGNEAMENAKSVTINFAVSENKEILDKLKNGVNKVYTFELLIEKNDGSIVKVHNFNNGVASILLSLTKEESKDLDISKLSVLHYNEETKKFDPIETFIEEEVVYFETSHFSSFVIGDKDANTKIDNPIATPISTSKGSSNIKTSDKNGILGFTVAALVSLGVVAVSVYGYKKRNLEK